MVELILFFTLAGCAIASAVLMIVQRNPLMSAMYLIVNFFCIAGLYLLLKAQFLAVIQIVVYTGAIMVLVIFVIMLLNLGDEQRLSERFDLKKIVGSVFALGFLVEMAYVFSSSSGKSAGLPPQATYIGEVRGLGDALFGRFVLPFEVTSFVLLAAIVGAVILAKRKT